MDALGGNRYILAKSIQVSKCGVKYNENASASKNAVDISLSSKSKIQPRAKCGVCLKSLWKAEARLLRKLHPNDELSGMFS